MPKKQTNSENETLVGIVTPVQWDDENQVTAVALSATDDQEYWIENGEKFFALVQKCIQVNGRVKRANQTTRTIAIKRFNVIENF